MKLEIEQLDSGYMLNVFVDGAKPRRYAFQSAYGCLTTLIETLAGDDEAMQNIGLKQIFNVRFATILETLKRSGKALTVNELAIQAAEQTGKTWSPHYQKGVSVALANAGCRDNSPVERVSRGVYRYRPEEVTP